MIVIACPGQGSQTPGFLNEWITDSDSRAFLEQLSERSGVDLITHGTKSDADTIRDTAIAQPLIVAASLLAWRALDSRADLSAAGVAGHSVGEFAAAALAGVLTPEEAIELVTVRGTAMAQAATEAETSMAAVVGGKEPEILELIVQLGLTPANRNGGGQIVAAGAVEQLTLLSEQAPRGSRVVPLQVAGAFHTHFMSSATPALSEAAQQVSPQDPTRLLWSNADGNRVHNGGQFVESLVSQVTQPVRWDSCIESFLAAGITGFIELTPAGALSGIAKRGLKGIPSVAIKSPEDLDAAVELLSSVN